MKKLLFVLCGLFAFTAVKAQTQEEIVELFDTLYQLQLQIDELKLQTEGLTDDGYRHTYLYLAEKGYFTLQIADMQSHGKNKLYYWFWSGPETLTFEADVVDCHVVNVLLTEYSSFSRDEWFVEDQEVLDKVTKYYCGLFPDFIEYADLLHKREMLKLNQLEK